MLMALGPVVFDRVSNLTGVDFESNVIFAKHDVVGSGPVHEATGGDGGSITLTGIIKPEHFGVNGALAALETAQANQIPLPLMRGDFVPISFVIIQKLKRTDAEINPVGIGREIAFTVDLLRVDAPGIGSAAEIMRLFL